MVEYTGVSMYRIEDGKIAEIWDTRNTLGIHASSSTRPRGGRQSP
jgi:predicted SnoaL-like aldol condensation-catalyzing enzyme